MRRPLDRLMGTWLGFATLLQALLLAADAPMSRAQTVQFFMGATCLMLLVMSLWRWRLYLNTHADMLLIMFASGGLGMLLGMSSHRSHATDLIVWWRMCAGMIVLGLAPAIAFSRCLRAARRYGYLLRSLLIDSSAMLAGMWLSTRVRIGHGEWMIIGQHVTMLVGMMLGMVAGMWIRSVLFSARSRTRSELAMIRLKRTYELADSRKSPNDRWSPNHCLDGSALLSRGSEKRIPRLR